jgi:lipopolysaccharide transport system ATP-binding protein
MKPILEIQHISKRFQISHQGGSYLSFRDRIVEVFGRDKSTKEDFWALRDVNFEVMPGESIGIVGSNGAGKSTLLKILSKITPPTTGKIISRGRMASLLEVGTGFHLELTGRENIFLNGSILGMKRKEIQDRFDEIVEFSGTEKFLDTPLKHYSSGMQLRLAFSVSAFLDPEILVIDEVLAVGDAEFQKKCLGKMEEVTTQGRTILFVSHNMAAVEHLCTRGIYLHEGQVVTVDKIDQVIGQYLKTGKDLVAKDNHGIPLRNGVYISEFSVDAPVKKVLSDLEYTLTLKSPSVNKVTDLSILLYNHLNERMGIIDLRQRDLWEKSAVNSEVTIKGKISQLPLTEGVYHLGLFIRSTNCNGDFLNLKRIEVEDRDAEFVPYAIKYRGFMEFKSEFVIH